MSQAALFFASGESLYLGSFLLLLAILASSVVNKRWMLILRNVVSWVGALFILLACPPYSCFVWAALALLFGVWFVCANSAVRSAIVTRGRTGVAAALFLILIVVTGSEFSHRRLPPVVGAAADHVTVIGDSLSAGIDGKTTAWPTLFQRFTGNAAKNLARAGASTFDARGMADSVSPGDRIVVVEIGGNDLLSNVPASEFEQNLDLLLTKLTTPGRTIVMFELPLLPNKIAYGRIQRRLAASHGVWLIPKRYLAEIIGGPGATVDGLHLSASGAQEMAELVAKVVAPVLIHKES
jgi:acyl-CoA thioesterase I